MAIGFGSGRDRLVVDFLGRGEGMSSSVYRPIEDLTAASLFFNNRAVERLVAGDLAGAEQLLRLLVAGMPDVQESFANLGAVLLRQGRAAEALAVSEKALVTFPEYQPLWANAVRAARRLGDHARATKLEADAARIADADPYLNYLRGVSAYEAKDFTVAIASLEKAVNGMSEGTLVRAWLVRAHFAGGAPDKGWRLFTTLRKDFPDDQNVALLQEQLPQLATAARPTPTDPPEFRPPLRKKALKVR